MYAACTGAMSAKADCMLCLCSLLMLICLISPRNRALSNRWLDACLLTAGQQSVHPTENPHTYSKLIVLIHKLCKCPTDRSKLCLRVFCAGILERSWIHLRFVRKMFSWKINRSCATGIFARFRLNRRWIKRKGKGDSGRLRSSCSSSGQSLAERGVGGGETEPDRGSLNDDSFWILSSPLSLKPASQFSQVSPTLRLFENTSLLHYCSGKTVLFFWSDVFSGFLVKADGKREFFLRQRNRAPLAGPEASPWGLLCASNSPSSFLPNSSFHPVISSPSSVLLLGSRSFVIFLHGRHQKQRSLRGKNAKPLYALPFCSGTGCTTRRQLLCFLYLPKKIH